jgi:hypothetical protein
MRSTLLLSLFALLLVGCPSEEVVEDPDVIWTPALTGEDTGRYDLGELSVGDSIDEAINIENNTDADMVVSVEFDLDSTQGFWGSALVSTQELTLAAGAETDVGFKLNATQAGTIESTIDFVFDNRVVKWTIVGTIVN